MFESVMNFSQERRVWHVPWRLCCHVFIIEMGVLGKIRSLLATRTCCSITRPGSSPRVTLGELLSSSPSAANQQVMQLVVEALRIIDQQPERANRSFPLIASYLLMIVSTLFGWTYDRGEKRRLEKIGLKHLGLAAHINGLLILSAVLCYMAGVLSGIYLILKGTFGVGYMRRSKLSLFLVWTLVTSTVAAPAPVVSSLVLGESYHITVLSVIWFSVVCFGIETARILTMSYLRTHQD